MAEALTRRELERRGVSGDVSSCGLLASDRLPPDEVVDEMASWDLDVEEHRSRKVTAELVSSASVVLAMERHHVREIVMLSPESFRHTFTLPEFARRLEDINLDETPRPDDLDGWLDLISEGRTPRELLGWGGDDEVVDPFGGPRKGFSRAAIEIEGIVHRVAKVLWPIPEDEFEDVAETADDTVAVGTTGDGPTVGKPAPTGPRRWARGLLRSTERET